MSMLFDAPPIAGLKYQDDFISAAEEQALIERLGAIDLAPFRFHGWLGNRKTQSFGWRYDFDDASFTPGEPIPDWLLPLQARAEAFAGLPPGTFVQALVARYDPGAGIGWHRDRDVFQTVVGISLGTPAALRFRQRVPGRFKRASVEVAPRSAYLLSGDARREWEHRITPGEQLRFSITFRSLSGKGRRIAERLGNGSTPQRFPDHVAVADPADADGRGLREGCRRGSPLYRPGEVARRRMGAGQ